MVHGNLCPENIILNKSGSWKIMGFDFSISSTNASDAEVRPLFLCYLVSRLVSSECALSSSAAQVRVQRVGAQSAATLPPQPRVPGA